MKIINVSKSSAKNYQEPNLLADLIQVANFLATTEENEKKQVIRELSGYLGQDDLMTITASTLNAALKVLYAGQGLSDVVYDESQRPLLTGIKKFKGFEGVQMPFPLLYEDGAGRSFDFTKAQANVGSPKLVQWQIDVVANYDVARITTEAVLRSGSNKGAFISGLKLNMDSAIRRLSNDVESSLFLDGSGSIGTISALSNGNKTVTLSSVDDIVHFQVGQKIVAADTTASALRSSTAGTVSAVDRDAGTVTFSSTIPATFDGYAGDVLFVEGDYASASDSNKIKGLEAWLPATAPSSGDSFFGVDRSVDPTRLAGVRYTGSSSNIEESIIGGAARLGRESGAVPNRAFMSYTTYRQLVNELGSKVQRAPGKDAVAGFQMLELYGPRGPITCVPATFCPDSVAYLLTFDTWQLVSMGEPVRLLDQDGLKIQRMSTADALEARIGSWCQLVCSAPGKNARIAL